VESAPGQPVGFPAHYHGDHQERRRLRLNANDATLTHLATAQTGSRVTDTAPNAPASGGFDLVLAAVAGSALGSSGTPYTLTISAIDLTHRQPVQPRPQA